MQSHNLEHKSSKRKRAFRKDVAVGKADEKQIKKLFSGGKP
jgi:ribosomal protein L35